MDRRIILTLASALALLSQIPSKACELAQITVKPDTAENGELYSGQLQDVRVTFHNYRTKGAVTVFPEPPLVITSLKSGNHCEADGGVWARNGVYISTDGKVLVTTEFSGSYDGLVFRDVRTCKKIDELDVSGTHWSIHGSQITWQPISGTPQTVRLDEACRPRAVPTASSSPSPSHS
ncbi:hypothetical protein [Dyella sp.]|uniref:hypothetical protein n=1 Tax=Dyella sp. TaxID=1869338 RepID=UPI002B472C03|nr:hypothetical protein [Dyella sp.]HKT28854.1 hypothetical protein [Dyella sp.]